MNATKKTSIRDYRALLVWQKSRALSKKGLKVLRAIRQDFISRNISSQLVRSILSIRANIVEGWSSRKGKSFVSYLEIARGSTGETEDWFSVLHEEGYIPGEVFRDISRDCRELTAMLTGLINTLRKR